MGGLLIVFMLMIIIGTSAVLMLFITKEKNKQNIAFIFAGIVSVIITFMSVTSFPTNFIIEKTVALLIEIPAIIGLLLYFIVKKYYTLSKILVASSIILGIITILI